MRAAGSVKNFNASPVGTWMVGKNFLVWNHDPGLGGLVVWDRPDAADVEAMLDIFDAFHRVCPSFDMVTDLSRIEAVSESAYAATLHGMRTRVASYGGKERRNAIVRADGMVGALVEGFFPLIGARDNWCSFTDVEQAFNWLGRPDIDRARLQVDQIVDEVRGLSPQLRQLRDFLKLKLAKSRVLARDAAHALGVSERTLHRSLRELGTCFRDELRAVRLQLATYFLAESDLKIETVAHRAGYNSHAYFTSQFRRATGRTPTEFRAHTAAALERASSLLERAQPVNDVKARTPVPQVASRMRGGGGVRAPHALK
jgi:AraC-like DNA-binding protein